MKAAIPSTSKEAQNPTRSSHVPFSGANSGRLAQLAAMMNQSPQVQAQFKLREEIQNSERVQSLMALAAEINHEERVAQAPSPVSFRDPIQNRSETETISSVVTRRQPSDEPPVQCETIPNRTGMPDQLKSGVESLSGLSLDDVRVHYNSDKPAQLSALAYAQGTDIHIAPGQENHLPHEAWHIVQQKQGRVQPTVQMKEGFPVHDDAGLEREAAAGIMQKMDAIQTNAVVQRKGGEEIIALLQKKLESFESLTKEEAAEILTFLKKTRRSAAESRKIRALLQTFPLEEGSDLYVFIHGAQGKKPPAKKKTRKARKPKRKREGNDDSSGSEKFSEPIFSDSASEVSEEEFDLEKYHKEAPEVLDPSMRHSRQEQLADSIDASNTNMTVFRGSALIPRTTGKTAKLNRGGHRKRKTRVRKRLKSGKNDLRGLQESYHWGSHLHVEEGTHFDPAKKKVRESLDNVEDESVYRLLTYTLPRFAQKDSEGHAEQSFLRSEAWVSLQQKLLASLKEFEGSTLADKPDGMEITLVLNRSSCIECGRAMAISTIHFWMQVAAAFELGDWREAMKKYKHVITFTARFPTIYEHKKEKRVAFKNIRSILSGLIAAGWTIQPFEPLAEGGRDSYKDLTKLLEEINPAEDSSKEPKGAKRKKKKGAKKGSKTKGEKGSEDSSDLSEGEKAKGRRGATKRPKVKGKGRKKKEEDSGDEDEPAPPVPSESRVDTGALGTFLTSINADWATPFADGGGGGGGAGSGGYMASQIAPRHRVALPPAMSVRQETLALEGHGLRVSVNPGDRALCFVYSVIMGLTGESAGAVRETVNYVARRAGAGSGWITSDSATAANVVREIEALFRTQIDVVVVQHGSGGFIISGRSGHFGQTTVVIRQTQGHYDAFVP